ncbi:PITH domain-containing protein [Radiomyces spectabilis]|uniref:PITH domain-containing protein n=1 Tax=Radiomyces spectabilis TaxID=64574 RepID=UPI0022210CFA|nr:PITH domain-containing protein [Radiomyces spectabilis]KAI8376184.1 PITH domain-containing protein [Radiomyces spectabilis]
MSFSKQPKTPAEFQELLASTQKLIVVDFYADWCGPCRVIAPFITQLASKYPDVMFIKINTDQAREVASQCGISAMPTFQFYLRGNKIDEMKGANPPQLEQLVKKHSGSTESSSSGSGSGSNTTFAAAPGHSDLTEYITPNQMDALNQQEEHGVRNIFKADESYLESDVDEQLIISIPFNQPVKLHSLKIKVANKNQAPKTIKLYANRQNLGFEDTDTIKETQTLELQPKDFEDDAIINLRFVKFQNITNLVLFIADNQEDEETTQIQQLILIGSPVEATNMKDLKKVGEE